MRGRLVILGVLAAAIAVGVPVILAAPPEGDPPFGVAAGKQDKPGRPDKADKAAKGPAVDVTLSGIVEQGTDDKGRPIFTMTVDGVTWELSAGPPWFWREGNPLTAWVGQTVEVAGSHRPESAEPNELSVDLVNGAPIRAPGKPPWAGGPHAVGEGHPGWKDWKAAAGGRPDGPPGQLKDKPGNRGGPDATDDAGG